MKTELKAKLLQHLVNNKSNEGFTLIELLVVIIIIGILSAIALPSFLNQAAKAKQSEAKSYVGSVNRAQQAFRIENPEFATDVTSLEIGIPTETVEYDYTIDAGSNQTTTIFNAFPARDTQTLKAYAGGVIVLETGQSEAVACQTEKVSKGNNAAVALVGTGGSSCAAGSEPMR